MRNSTVRNNKFVLFLIDSELSEYKKNIANLSIGFNEYNINAMKKMYKGVRAYIYHKFHFLGNIFGLKCNRCKHSVKYHETVDLAKWKCKECDKYDNICMVADRDDEF